MAVGFLTCSFPGIRTHQTVLFHSPLALSHHCGWHPKNRAWAMEPHAKPHLWPPCPVLQPIATSSASHPEQLLGAGGQRLGPDSFPRAHSFCRLREAAPLGLATALEQALADGCLPSPLCVSVSPCPLLIRTQPTNSLFDLSPSIAFLPPNKIPFRGAGVRASHIFWVTLHGVYPSVPRPPCPMVLMVHALLG